MARKKNKKTSPSFPPRQHGLVFGPLWRQHCRDYRVLARQYDTEAGGDVQNARPPPSAPRGRFTLNSCQGGVKNGRLFTAGS